MKSESLSKFYVAVTRAEYNIGFVYKKRLQKKFKKISTRLLTVLTVRAIVQIEQRKRDKESRI